MNNIEERKDLPRHSWPTRVEKLLIKAAILDPEEAIPAWEEWKTLVSFDDLEGGSVLIIPLVFDRLHSYLRHDPLMNRCKSIYCCNWVKNQCCVQKMVPELKMISERGVKILFLKGASLFLNTYLDYGLRPIGDIDILVPQERAVEVMCFLHRRGWKVPKAGNISERDIKKIFKRMHSANFEKDGLALDIHWHPTGEFSHKEVAEGFFQRAKPVHWEGFEVWLPDPADQLITACLHGLQSCGSTIRWVVDAAMILKAHPNLDWDRIVRIAQKHHVAYLFKRVFRYLREELHVEVPKEVLQDIGAVKVSRAEKALFVERARQVHYVKGLFLEASNFADRLLQDYFYFLLAQYDRRQFNRLGILTKLLKFTPFAFGRLGFWNIWRIPFYYIFLFARGRFSLLT